MESGAGKLTFFAVWSSVKQNTKLKMPQDSFYSSVTLTVIKKTLNSENKLQEICKPGNKISEENLL